MVLLPRAADQTLASKSSIDETYQLLQKTNLGIEKVNNHPEIALEAIDAICANQKSIVSILANIMNEHMNGHFNSSIRKEKILPDPLEPTSPPRQIKRLID